MCDAFTIFTPFAVAEALALKTLQKVAGSSETIAAHFDSTQRNTLSQRKVSKIFKAPFDCACDSHTLAHVVL